MKIPAVNFTSVKTGKCASHVKCDCANSEHQGCDCNKKVNPYKMSDILPITLGCGLGLLALYVLRCRKCTPVKQTGNLACIA